MDKLFNQETKSPQNERKRVYVSGKISGIGHEIVREKFNRAKERLESEGFEVITPLDNCLPEAAPWETHMQADIILLMSCSSLYLLTDWEESKGATLEKNIAEQSGKTIMYESEREYVEIKSAIADALGVEFYDIIGHSRTERVAYARMIFTYLLRQRYGLSTSEIARVTRHHHTTIFYYLSHFDDNLHYIRQFRDSYDSVMKSLIKQSNNSNIK